MKVAVYLPEHTPYSMKYCAASIMSVLEKKHGVTCTVFKSLDSLPPADIYWDPRCGGGIAPPIAFRKTKKPLVLTVHGMAMFTLPLNVFYFTPTQKIRGLLKKWKERLKWKLMEPHISQVMTVSDYTKNEMITAINFPERKITAVWNGLEPEKFKPAAAAKNTESPYFLTVISYQKKKNFERLLEAYKQLDENSRPRLVAIVKPYEMNEYVKGLEIINTPISEERLIAYYQHALALVFVSLHEGFGLPIVESMACGVPVITSNSTSCKEIAGDAALLVDPTSVNAIAAAMEQLTVNNLLRQQLIQKGLDRASHFNWENSAAQFYKLLLEASSQGV